MIRDPKGSSANFASLKNCLPKGLPMIVLTVLIFVSPTVNAANSIFGFERLGLRFSVGFSGGVAHGQDTESREIPAVREMSAFINN